MIVGRHDIGGETAVKLPGFGQRLTATDLAELQRMLTESGVGLFTSAQVDELVATLERVRCTAIAT